MMYPLIGKRKQVDLKEGDCAFKQGSKEKIKLDTSFFVNGLMCKLNITHANGAKPSFNEPKLLTAFESISIVANANEHLKTLTPHKIYANEIRNFGKLSHFDIDTTANQTVNSFVTFFIPFSMIKMIVGEDTILDTSSFSSLNLFVQWADNKALGSDITISSGDLHVYSMAIENHVYNKNEPIKYYVENSIDNKEVTSNNDTFQFELPNDKIYKSLILAATVDGKMSDTVIENIKVKSGSKIFLDWDADILRSKNIREMGIIDESLLKGHYLIDPTQRGRITDSYNIIKSAGGYNKLTVILKVKKGAGETYVSLSSDEFESTQIVPNP